MNTLEYLLKQVRNTAYNDGFNQEESPSLEAEEAVQAIRNYIAEIELSYESINEENY